MTTFRKCCNGNEEKIEVRRKSNLSHILYTVIIVGAACAISLTTDCLNFVQELSVSSLWLLDKHIQVTIINFQGLFAAVPIAFVLPGFCYIKLSDSKLMSWDKMPALLLALFGIAVAINGIVSLSFEGIPTCTDSDIQFGYCKLFNFN